MTFNIEGYGTVSTDNAVWQRCTNYPKIEKMKVGDKETIAFQSGAGTTETVVERIS